MEKRVFETIGEVVIPAGADKEKLFFALLGAGLWGQRVRLLSDSNLDFPSLYQMAEEQSVIGLITSGLELVSEKKFPVKEIRSFIQAVIVEESRNKRMNLFIAGLFDRLTENGITPVLVKGQGISQCYLNPLWRSSGDIDILVSEKDYKISSSFLSKLNSRYAEAYKNHRAYRIDGWDVELHGSLHAGLSNRMNRVLDSIQEEMFKNNSFRQWDNGSTIVLLPAPNEDVVFVFSHILQHFYKGGVGLRQICDWCRLLFCYQEEIDRNLIERRLCEMRILLEWKVFGCLAVRFLGFPREAFPLYEDVSSADTDRVLSFILAKGNFGNKINKYYFSEKSIFQRKTATFFRQFKDYVTIFNVFPKNTLRAGWYFLLNQSLAALKVK